MSPVDVMREWYLRPEKRVFLAQVRILSGLLKTVSVNDNGLKVGWPATLVKVGMKRLPAIILPNSLRVVGSPVRVGG